MDKKTLAGIVMSSDSGLEVMKETTKILDKFGIGYEKKRLMQEENKETGVRVEFIKNERGDLEIRYFDNCRDSRYRSWKMSKGVADELICWWERLRNNKNINFPIKERTKICEFNMYTEKYIDIREFDSLGRYKMTGWSLPKAVVEELITWDVKNKGKI